MDGDLSRHRCRFQSAGAVTQQVSICRSTQSHNCSLPGEDEERLFSGDWYSLVAKALVSGSTGFRFESSFGQLPSSLTPATPHPSSIV